MKFYFSLQYQMLRRNLIEFGLNPILGFFLAITAFIGLSFLIFYKTNYAIFIYPIIALSFTIKFGESKRNDFLRSAFSELEYRYLRSSENLIIVFPFVLFLLYKNQIVASIGLFFGSVLMSFFNFKDRISYTIPTPFSKKPFEFLVGFRRIFLVFFLAYFLTFMSIYVDNYGLGLFSIAIVFGACMTFYGNIETEFYVWIFSMNPSTFLKQKILTAALYATFLVLPISISLILSYPQDFYFVLIVVLFGYIYLINTILAKYSAYPEPMNLPQAILFGMSIMMPPFLLFIMPLFYRKSVENLKYTLK